MSDTYLGAVPISRDAPKFDVQQGHTASKFDVQAGHVGDGGGNEPADDWGVLGKIGRWATTPFDGGRLEAQQRAAGAQSPPPFPLTAGSGDLRTALQAFLTGVPGHQPGSESDEAQQRLALFREKFPILSRALPFAGGMAQPAMLPMQGARAAAAAVPAVEGAASAAAPVAAAAAEAERDALLQSWRAIREGRAPVPALKVVPPEAEQAASAVTPAAAPAQVPQLAGESFGAGPSRPQRGATGSQLAYRAQRFGVAQPKPSIGAMDLSPETQAKLLQALDSEKPPMPSPSPPTPAPSPTGAGGALADYVRKNAAKEIGTGVGALLGHPFLGRMAGAGVDKALQSSEAFKSLASKMTMFAKTSPQLMGKFGPPLLQASMRGADALAVTHYQLSQTPEYQQLMRVASQTEDQK